MIKYKNSSQHTTPHTGGATKAPAAVARRRRPATPMIPTIHTPINNRD